MTVHNMIAEPTIHLALIWKKKTTYMRRDSDSIALTLRGMGCSTYYSPCAEIPSISAVGSLVRAALTNRIVPAH